MAQGTRLERAQKSLRNMGPAVLKGGFSTFLSFILLANSNSHVFETFFKIFFLVIMFALYNGLVILPIILSHIGPETEEMNNLQKSNVDVKLESQPENAEQDQDGLEEVNQKMLPDGVS